MSVLHAAATVAATPIPTPIATPLVTPTPLPPASPAVDAAAHAAANVVQANPSILDIINTVASSVGQPELILAGGAIAVALQAGLNKLPFLQHKVDWIETSLRRFVAVVLPVLGTAAASFASGHNELHLAPGFFLAGQAIYWTIDAWRKLRKSRATTEPAAPAEPQLGALTTDQDPSLGVG